MTSVTLASGAVNSSAGLTLKVNNTTSALDINTSGAVGVGSTPAYGTSGQVLISAGSGAAPAWGNNILGTAATATNVAGGTTGAVVYQTGTGTTGFSAAGTSGQILTSAGTSAPTWTDTLTSKTFTNYTETAYVANSSTAITLALTNGTVQIITLTGNATITMPTAVAGKSFLLLLKQDATGSRTVTWSTVKWPAATAPTVTSTASKQDIYSFFSDGTNWYGTTVGQNYTP
jgi:hypothetical protein